ncbi:hypothetical protein PoB_001541500 [Plakobranchus ocellatus]|uniref:Uncharacterized protein n=1 Tax=Plakobranchus ocellatus TaxID=259542 RepID=A0AAV3Z0I9_9GAST|nr:hypothetical protein PoB_001541500 [Plakobranchus ocellatus]
MGRSPQALNAARSHDNKHWSASPQQGDLRLSGPPSGQGAVGGVRTSDRRVPQGGLASHWAIDAPSTIGGGI